MTCHFTTWLIQKEKKNKKRRKKMKKKMKKNEKMKGSENYERKMNIKERNWYLSLFHLPSSSTALLHLIFSVYCHVR